MPNEAIRMTAHAIGAAVDFNEIGADDEFVDAPAHDHLQRGFNAAVETVQMRDARIRDLEAAVETGRTALTVSQDAAAHWEHKYTNARQYNRNLEERCQRLEAALRDCTERGANVAVIVRNALESAPETKAEYPWNGFGPKTPDP